MEETNYVMVVPRIWAGFAEHCQALTEVLLKESETYFSLSCVYIYCVHYSC